MASYVLLEQASHIKALVLDVDGILSDGFVTFTNTGDEIKSFDIRDGLGMKLAQQAGLKVIVITGRKSHIVEKRMSDLKVDLVFKVVKIKVWHYVKHVRNLTCCHKIVYTWAMTGQTCQHLRLQA
jgi:3-deoxy-D-manno-octulosonate 8-phosphate phosphatase (KDO 8-P phosphatase)